MNDAAKDFFSVLATMNKSGAFKFQKIDGKKLSTDSLQGRRTISAQPSKTGKRQHLVLPPNHLAGGWNVDSPEKKEPKERTHYEDDRTLG